MRGLFQVDLFRAHAAQVGDALQDLGEPLQTQESEGDGDAELERPAREAAGVGGLLPDRERVRDEVPADPDGETAEGDQQ